MCFPAVHGLEFATPPAEKSNALSRVADFISKVVSPAAKCIEVVEILVEALRE
jgi:hypothetical protein